MSRLNSKILDGGGLNISKKKKFLFCKCRQIRLKPMIFLFYDLPACNKNAESLPLPTALTAHLRSQFNHVFALLIPMTRFKIINFCYNRSKIKLFLQKNCKICNHWGLCPQTPVPSAVGGAVSCGRTCPCLIDNLFVVFWCLCDVLSTLKCLIVW